jgi:hypothetical protein
LGGYISQYKKEHYVKRDIRKDLYERFIKWCGENSINICLEKALSLLEKSSTDAVSISTNVISKSDELKPRVFCKSKSEIRDISRYVKKLKDEGVLIDWWDEGSKYCFEVKE